MKTAAIKFKTTDEYFKSLPAVSSKRLKELRAIIRKLAPQAEELISYNMPAFKLNRILVWYAAFHHHIGLYPTASPIKVFKEELSAYKTSKGAIQFPIDKAIPKTLVKKIIIFRI